MSTLLMPDISYDKPNIEFQGRSFCFTGHICQMKQKDAEAVTQRLGGIIKGSTVKDLDYLVVGPHIQEQRGKVNEALQLRDQNTGVAIVHHEYWFECLTQRNSGEAA